MQVFLLADNFIILLGELSGRYAEMAQPKNFFKQNEVGNGFLTNFRRLWRATSKTSQRLYENNTIQMKLHAIKIAFELT